MMPSYLPHDLEAVNLSLGVYSDETESLYPPLLGCRRCAYAITGLHPAAYEVWDGEAQKNVYYRLTRHYPNRPMAGAAACMECGSARAWGATEAALEKAQMAAGASA